jgi:acetyl esterase/lipase
LLAGGLAVGVVGVAASCGLFGDDGPERFDYGDHPMQFSELWRPSGDGPWSTVVMIHGGSWSRDVDRTIMDPICRNLAGEGHAVWNIDYRRLGQRGGGWPGTFTDVAAAIDDVMAHADDVPVDADRIVLVGHSAGGQLALWGGARAGLSPNEPGAGPRVAPRAVVALAPVPDMARCADAGALQGTCAAVMGGMPNEVPERYAVASPQARLPLGLPQRVFHGTVDTVVPLDYSRSYVAAAQAAGDDATLREQPDANHFSVLEPSDQAWQEVRQTINRLLNR